MESQLLIDLNKKLDSLLNPQKKLSKTDKEKISAYGEMIVRKYAKKHLKKTITQKGVRCQDRNLIYLK